MHKMLQARRPATVLTEDATSNWFDVKYENEHEIVLLFRFFLIRGLLNLFQEFFSVMKFHYYERAFRITERHRTCVSEIWRVR